ncbi:FAD-binding protein [Vibrio lentus]|nr:FAD-binding protein [Vibrio lentus]
MERYAPNAKDLAGRDVVARSMMVEIREGRGCDRSWGPHRQNLILGKRHLNQSTPGVCETFSYQLTLILLKNQFPVIPTCHYMMGGVRHRFLVKQSNKLKTVQTLKFKGLFACGRNRFSISTRYKPSRWQLVARFGCIRSIRQVFILVRL